VGVNQSILSIHMSPMQHLDEAVQTSDPNVLMIVIVIFCLILLLGVVDFLIEWWRVRRERKRKAK